MQNETELYTTGKKWLLWKRTMIHSLHLFSAIIFGRNQGDAVIMSRTRYSMAKSSDFPRTLKRTAATIVVTSDVTAINSIFLPTPDSSQLTRSSIVVYQI